MDSILLLASWGGSALLVLMTLGWIVSLIVANASLVDQLWGLTFVIQVWVYGLVLDSTGVVPWLLVFLVTVWGVRLALHIHLRNRDQGEDYRYVRMREAHGARFWWYSLFSVFLLQGLISFVVAAPLLVVMARQTPVNGLGFVLVGVLLWLVGFGFEAVGDWQLARFKADPANQGRVLDTGLWGLTRHPNYFGDATLWWGYYLIAVSVQHGWVTLFGPLLMTILIRYVSGVAMLDEDQSSKRPQYREYIRNTPAFIPRLWPR